MAISIVGTNQGGSATNGGDVTLTFSVGAGAPAVGDHIYVFGGRFTRAGTYGPDTANGTYEQVALYTTEIANYTIGIWRRIITSSPPTVVVCKGSGNSADATAYCSMVVRGADATFDAAIALATGASTNPNPPSITAVNGSLAVIWACSTSSDSAPGTVTNYTALAQGGANDTNAISCAIGTRAISSSGAEDPPAWSAWTTGTWAAHTFELRPNQTASAAMAGAGALSCNATKAKFLIIEAYAGFASDVSEFGKTTGHSEEAQTITLSASATLLQASFVISTTGSPTDGVVCQLKSTDGAGKPTGLAIATSDVVFPAPYTGGPDNVVTFTFSTEPVLSPVKYAFDIFRNGAQSDSDYYQIKWNNPGSYSGGDYAFFSGSWVLQNPFDAVLTLNIGPPTASALLAATGSLKADALLRIYFGNDDLSSNWGTVSNTSEIGQEFTASANLSINTCTFSLQKNASPTDNVFVNIYASDVNHLPTGSSLGQSNARAGSGFSTSLQPEAFTFSSPVNITSG
ncbi:MAG TPA: hypothetical protein VLF67_04885, partial [Candidatus Saccharimonas sp.]|nr:hypothetical protein [Candidatus Saccharimonas sp.]